MIVIFDNNQDILTHHNQQKDLCSTCRLIDISTALIKEIASVKPKHYIFCTETTYSSILL